MQNLLDKQNGDPSARYLVEERRNDLLDASLNSTLESKLKDNITLNAGVSVRATKGMTFNTINDLLGADYHIDVDKFGERDFLGEGKQNDLRNPDRKVKEGDRYAYDYNLLVNSANIWGQNQHEYAKINLYYGLKLTYTEFARDGKMQNGRYPLNSYGKGETHSFFDPSVKAGLVYKVDGRNFIVLNAGFQTKAPLAYDAYISPRVSDKAMPDLKSEKIWNVDLGYTFSLPTLSGRVSVFQTNFYDQMKKVSYYSDIDATYVHHVMKDINTIHHGVELGLIWKATSNLTVNLGGTISEYYYANRPKGIVSYENNQTVDSPEETVYIKNFYVGGTPQTAGTIGVDYFYNYWFFGANVNGFANAYLDPSPIQRTSLAVNNLPIEEREAYLAKVEQLSNPSKLHGGMTLDVSIGKLLFFRNGKSMSINLSVNNVLNYKNLQTGGYEQGRIDVTNLNKFPPKYYYMQGINCYFNVNYKF
jgi:outer membrane receptor protein involved in Fe transport